MADSPRARSGRSNGGRSMGRLIPFVAVMVLMGIEGVGVFFLTKLIAAPPAAALATTGATESSEGQAGTTADFAEIELADCRPTNVQLGRLITYHIRVLALVAASDRQRAEEMARERKARIEDRVSIVVRSSEPKQLNEPELTTIKRRIKHELDEIFGDDQLFHKVLIPHLLQSGP